MQTLAIYNVTLFGINMTFDSVAFTLPIGNGWNVYWYGICIAVGFLLAIIYGFVRAKKFDVNIDRLTDVVLVTTPLAILCARLYYIIFDSKTEINSIADLFGFNSGSGVSGLAIYGGVIGAFAFGLLMCKLRKVNILDAFDLAASGFLIGQAIGRWGNFFNQEAFGTPTGSEFWGMTNQTLSDYVHPCFLYESIWCLLGFILLHFIGNRRKFKGQLALTYGVWYGFGRMFIEGLRTDSLYLGPLRISQWLSGLLVIVCGAILIYMFKKLKTAKSDLNYTAMFDDIDPNSIKGIAYYEGEDEASEETDAEPADEATETDDTEENDNNG